MSPQSHTSTHDASRHQVSVAIMPHIKRRKFASGNSASSYYLFAVVMRYYPAAEANQMAVWVTRLESLSAEHAAKYRRRQEEEERKKRTEKGERRGNGTKMNYLGSITGMRFLHL